MTDILNEIWADAEKRRLFAQICILVAELVDVPEPDDKEPVSLFPVPTPPGPKDEDDDDGDDEKPETEEKLA